MRTMEDFHTELLATARSMVSAAMSEDGADLNDWTLFVAPFFESLKGAIVDGLRSQDYFTPIFISSLDGDEATVSPIACLFADDDDAEFAEGDKMLLSDLMLYQYPYCTGSAENIIAAVERSCAIAREKLAAK